MHKLSDYDYQLPEGLIAQDPAEERDRARLLVVERSTGRYRDETFARLLDYAKAGDLLVFNDTRVVPARLLGRRSTGGAVEILVLGPASLKRPGQNGPVYEALIKPLARLKEGEEILLEKGLVCRLIDAKGRLVDFAGRTADEVMKMAGVLPLPPYVRRSFAPRDKIRYQTVFAKYPGAVAAPTAGLHFTHRLLQGLRRRGVRTAFLTLHVGYGTFSPVRAGDIREHLVHEEFFRIPSATVKAIRRVKQQGAGRVIAVGTTVVRALEDAAPQILDDAGDREVRRMSRLFVYPPFTFRITDAMITNFHLPRTSLLMLVAAFAGRQRVLEAYRHAVEKKYRFYSYGDAMFIV